MQMPMQYCSVCGREVAGPMEDNRCSNCGRLLCPFCVRKQGGFLGFGGEKYCPYCLK